MLKAIIKQRELFESSMPSSLRKIAEQQSSIQSVLNSGAFNYAVEWDDTLQSLALNSDKWLNLSNSTGALASLENLKDIVRQNEDMFASFKQPIDFFETSIFSQIANNQNIIKDILPVFKSFNIDEIFEELEAIDEKYLANQESVSQLSATIAAKNSDCVGFTDAQQQIIKNIASQSSGSIKRFVEELIISLGVDAVKKIFMAIINIIYTTLVVILFSHEPSSQSEISSYESRVNILDNGESNSNKKLFKPFIAVTNQDFFLRAGRTKGAPLVYKDKVREQQSIEVVGQKGNWLKVEIKIGEGSITGWTQRHTINRVQMK